MPDVELLQFRFSPYNEKVRWALDYKRIPHRRRSLLPGPHMAAVKRRTGQTQTPIVALDSRWIAGSPSILAALEAVFPDPALFPTDPRLRERACEIEKLFGDGYGPDIRRALLTVTMRDLRYTARLFAAGSSSIGRVLYGATMPLAAPLIRKGNGLDQPRAYERGMEATTAALDTIAGMTAATGYCIGSTFTIADLAAASMLASVVNPADSPMARPLPMPEGLASWIAQWHDHPGAAWVRTMYAEHRHARTDRDGLVRYDR